MRKVISVVNFKGGVGKTTSAVNIAACIAEMGKKVLLIDLDPQGSATASYGITDRGASLLTALQSGSPLPVMPTCLEEVNIVPSGPELLAINRSGTEETLLLTRCLERTDDQWDVVLIDCPPSIGVLSLNALMACKNVLVPVEASFLGLHGLKQMVSVIDQVKEKNPQIDIDAVIPCRAHRRRRIHWEIMDTLKEMFPGKVSPIVRENVSLAEAAGKGKPVILSARLSKGADDYRFVTMWLDERFSFKNKEGEAITGDPFAFENAYSAGDNTEY